MAYTSGSEDDFPDIEVVVRRHKQKTRAQKDQHSHQEETAPADRQLPKERRLDRESAEPSSAPAVKATPLRRRKLGQTQTQKVDSSLLKPWNELDMGRKQKEPPTGSNAPRLRSREGTAEASDSSKPTLPAEQSKPRTASSRPALRSAELGESSGAPSQLVTSTQRESKAGKGTTNSRRARRKVVYSSESEEDSEGSIDDPEPSENDEGSEFLSAQEDSDTVIWNSDSELFLTPPTRRSKSPSERHTKPSRKGASKTSPTNDAPSATIAKGSKNPTPTEEPKAKSKNRGQRGNPASKASEATQKKGNLEDAFEKLKM
ncbi:hypothetical protein F4778DRAFT_66924 [Xylariomycetidae sp. FL2044]|nr:hypothetical protein F4778DRAFT_66924 [Xylariomycetidae sp. FL2044]